MLSHSWSGQPHGSWLQPPGWWCNIVLFHRYLPEPAEGVPTELPSGQHLGVKVLSERWPRRDPRRSERTRGEDVLRRRDASVQNPAHRKDSRALKWPSPVQNGQFQFTGPHLAWEPAVLCFQTRRSFSCRPNPGVQSFLAGNESLACKVQRHEAAVTWCPSHFCLENEASLLRK